MTDGTIAAGSDTDKSAARVPSGGTSAGVARSAGVVSLAVMASRVFGLLREMVFAYFFGASRSYHVDAYVMAFRIPNLLRDLFAEGALSSAFVTVFSEYLVKKDEREAFRLSNLVATSLIVILGVVVVIGMIFTNQIVGFLASGYKDIPNKFEDTVHLTRIMMPFILLVALAAQSMGVLNARGKFGIPAISSSFFNIGSIVGGLVFAALMTDPMHPISAIKDNPGDGIVGMAYGVLIGGFLQYAVQWPSLLKAGFRFRPLLSITDPGLRQVFRLMGPAVIGAAAVQVNVMVNSSFASSIPSAVAWLSYAFRFMQFPIGVFGVAIATATLPSISRSAALENRSEFKETLAGSIRLAFVLTIPSTVGLIVLGRPIVALLYEHGTVFTTNDTNHTAAALACYAVGLAGYSAVKILAPAFYALGDARTPMAISLATMAVNFVLNWWLVSVLQERGLALCTSTVGTLNFVLLYALMRRRIGGIEGRKTAAAVVKILLASALMAVVCWAISRSLGAMLAANLVGRLLVVGVSVGAGATVFYFASRLLGIRELKMAVDAIAGRFFRPLQRRARP